ncbi:universal stress protein [Bacillus solitudinis]|uniref:universal stress protein n=1 Tax=Bacillus solitudinis TaxID=2014074 RepID=UPI000C23829A|nr:universal stress protein [Bacillus solitudinis]
MFKHILVPVDGSEHSMRSTEKAIALSKLYDGKVDLIYVIDGSTSKHEVLTGESKIAIELKRKERLKPIEAKLVEAGIEFETHILNGEPGPTIVKFANEGNYDCVIMGSRGLNKLQTMVLGSVSHKVAKRVECPVMIIK